MRLCLVRHGETDWNAAGRIQGQLDVPLNARGQQQAQAVAAALATQPFNAVFSSDLSRAQQTAAAVAQRQQLPVQTLNGWRERHHGRMQGQTYCELASSWPEGHQRLRARDPDFEVDGGESLRQLAARCRHNLTELTALGQPCVLVVTHGGVLDVLHRLVCGEPLHTPRRVAIRNCAIHWLEHLGGTWTVLSWGDETHLQNARDELPD